MAFLVETGSGDAGANAYISVAYFRTHHTDRGNSAHSDFSTSEVESAIIRATEYIDKRFGPRFRGFRNNKGQGLEWPRFDAFDNDGFLLSGVDDLPRNLEKACAEYALRALIYIVLAPDPIRSVPNQDLTDSTGTRETDLITGEVTRKRDRVGPLEEERWYETRSQVLARNLGVGARGVQSGLLNDFNIPEYPEADLWLEELLRSSMNISLSRGN
jgi:hypothetical protein